MKTATIEDFKVGTTLTDSEDLRIHFTLIRLEQDGVWIGRNDRGEKCIFECEASGYLVGA